MTNSSDDMLLNTAQASLPLSRRRWLTRMGTGFGTLGLASVLSEAGLLGTGELQAAGSAASGAAVNPLAPKLAHFAPRAKRVIFLFMNGGPSQVDTFDPKPELQRRGGQTISDGNLKTERPTGALFPSPYRFHRYGQSGIEVSDLFLGKFNFPTLKLTQSLNRSQLVIL